MQSLSDDEKAKVLIQVDHFIEIVEKRSGLEFDEVVDVLRWAKQRKAFYEKLIEGGALAAIGLIISAILYAIWKGVVNGFRIDG